MKLSLVKDLEPLRERALFTVDAEAGTFRSQFITVAAGQELVYAEKRREAEAVMAGAAEGETPHVLAESRANGITPFQQAVEILTLAQQWSVMSSRIEVARLSAKIAITAAKSPAEIEDAMPDWSLIALS